MKLCTDCIHLRGRTCRNPHAGDTSMIDGEMQFYNAAVVRNISVCGVEAKLFEQKPLNISPAEPF